MNTEIGQILKEVHEVLSVLDSHAQDKLSGRLMAAKRIFVAGAGRSGLMIRCFAMRLMHLGMQSFVVGESTTPAIRPGDLLLIASGSGNTNSLVGMAKKAVDAGASLALVTISPDSQIGALTDCIVVLHAPTKSDRCGEGCSVQPMAALFEQCLMIFFDALVLQLMKKTGESADEMYLRHANLE